MLKLFGKYPGHFTVLQHCMHGGTRDKKSKFCRITRGSQTQIFWQAWAFFAMDSINMMLGNRVGWAANYFSDGRRSRLPYNFVSAICFRLSRRSQVPCLSPCQSLQQQLMVDPSVGKRNLFAAQSRGNKLKQILAEYGREVTAAIPVGYQHIDKLLREFPKGTNVIHRQLHWGFTRDEWRRKSSTLVSSIEEGTHFEVLTLGIPRDPADFIKDAHEIGHPRRAFAQVPTLMREALEEVFLGDPFEIKSKRADFLKK